MKNFTKFFLSLALMLMALPNVLGAADFTKDGVCYNINSDGISLTVVSSSPKYSGDIVIPSQVMWNNVEYSVTSIGGSAFRGCTGLTSIEIPDGVTSIGGSAFSGCTGLTSVLWNAENCTFIGSYSFQDCAIEKFLFGESVKTIPGNCCYGMNNLTSIEIPNNVTSIGKTAFGGCESLSSIKVSEDNHVYDSRESSNAIIKTNTNELVAGCKSTVIPYGVTSIGYAAFVNCTGLTSIAIPNSVTSIGNESFNGCTGLTSISIPNNVTSVGASAFYGCTGLKSISIPNSVTSVGASAFSGCTGLTSIEIPDGVTTIWSGAFSRCTNLTSVAWNAENCTSINSNTFQDCAIEKFLFGESVKTIPGNCCYGMNNLTSIEIPNSVTSIGENAFYKCTGLKSISILNSVTSVGVSAFYGCTGLTSVLWNAENCTSINSNTFQNCPIEKFLFGESVKTIPGGCCYGMNNLTSIEIPNSVTSIGGSAFSGCTGLTSILIPDGVTTIGYGAFSGCTGLTSVLWNAENCTWIYSNTFQNCPIEKFLFGESVKTIPGNCCYGMNNLTSIAIPNSVTSIGNESFYGCTGLKSISIPNSVTSVGGSAFYGCTRLTSVLWNAENCTSINSNTFHNCPIEKFLFGESVKTITDNCCYGMGRLTSIEMPDGVTSIGGSAFSGCTGLTSIEIPNSVTSVGASAFYGCTGLTSVLWNAENCTWIYSNTFQNCPIEKFLFGESVKTIPANCCYGMNNLTSIEIPNSVTSVGASAFYGCTGLTSIEIPNSVTSIGENAFYKCTGLTSIELPNNVTSIESSAFSGCYRLKSIEIPNSVTSVGASAFYGCTGLTSIKILNGNATVGKNNLTKCNSLTYIEAPSGLMNVDDYNMTFMPNSVETLIVNGGEVSDNGYDFIKNQINTLKRLDLGNASAVNIPSEAFKIFKRLVYVVLPKNVSSIGSSAFFGCTSLKSISIPNSVTSVGGSAFYGCTGLTSIEIPDGVTSIGGSAFSGCTGLTSVLWNAENCTFIGSYSFQDCAIEKFLFGESVKTIPGGCCYGMNNLTSIEIPNSVTSIGGSAFSGCTGLTSIEIPDGVTSIGGSAFSGCTGLTSVLWNAENCTFIGSYSFQDCAIEKFLFGESVKTIPGNCCYGMNNLTSIEIPNSVTSIGGSAFSGCTGLTSIEIPDGVTSIGGSAFSGCTGLTYIEIPNSVTSIGSSAFSGCTGLTSIEIPNSVTLVRQSAFYDCKGLISITIPNGVTTIEQSVFGGCTGLTSVVWDAENCTSINSNTFQNCPIEKFTFGESVKTIPANCCYGMAKLTSIEIPNNITTIGGSAFGNCTNLQSIKILNGNATIGKNNLTNCKGLTYIEAPASLIDVAEADMGNVTNSVETLIVNGGEVNENGYKFIDNQRKNLKCLDLSGASNKEIADEAFLDFYKPKFIFLPEGTTSIGYKSFSGCVSLRFARIPSSVTDIEYNAFNDCVGLEYIYCSAETPPTVVSAFTNVDKEIPVYVPCGKVDLYKKAKGWKEFENILCIDEAKQSEEVVAEPTAEPEETSVQLTWAVEHTAGKYVVTVMQGDEVVSILTFDPKGALIDYSTGSSRSASGLRSADANANSFVYTVKGLSKDTEYTYSVEVFDYDGAETEKYVGQFKTLGEVAVDENKFGENVSIKDAVSVFNKTVSVNGYEPSDIRVYNTVGQPVSNPVPASGVYVVKVGDEAVKVMVK